MAINEETRQFIENKMYLLNKCIGINKDLAAAGDDTDAITSLIEQRGLVLKTLDELNATTAHEIKRCCSQAQKDSVNRLVTLLLDMDKELSDSLAERKLRMKSMLKNTVQNKKALHYASLEVDAAGTYMNFRK